MENNKEKKDIAEPAQAGADDSALKKDSFFCRCKVKTGEEAKEACACDKKRHQRESGELAVNHALASAYSPEELEIPRYSQVKEGVSKAGEVSSVEAQRHKHHGHGDKHHCHDDKHHGNGEKDHCHGHKHHGHGDKHHCHGGKHHEHGEACCSHGKHESYEGKSHCHDDKHHGHGEKEHCHGHKHHGHGDKHHCHGHKHHGHGDKHHCHGGKHHEHGEACCSHGKHESYEGKSHCHDDKHHGHGDMKKEGISSFATGHPHSMGHPHGAMRKDGMSGNPSMRFLSDGKTPPLRLVAWEVTRSCNLACKHCRAEAHLDPYPGELSTEESLRLIDTFTETGNPIIIFTGGEPLLRKDIFELVSYANSKGLRCVMAPNGTLITADIAKKMAESGIQRCSISIDGPEAQSHDTFRGVIGAFDQAMQGIQYLKDAGIEFQINSTVTKSNLKDFKKIFHLAETLGAAAWHIFLLVPMGRASQLAGEVITAAEYEEVLNWFYDFRKTTSMHLKATCAPHYYRIMRQRAKEDGIAVTPDTFGMDALTRGCLGGTGFCFISHSGQVQPCGYLELDCGNVRDTSFPEIWRNAEVFRQFRTPVEYLGKCGICEYHKVCGGCRARAYSLHGDHMKPEPLCTYEPRVRS